MIQKEEKKHSWPRLESGVHHYKNDGRHFDVDSGLRLRHPRESLYRKSVANSMHRRHADGVSSRRSNNARWLCARRPTTLFNEPFVEGTHVGLARQQRRYVGEVAGLPKPLKHLPNVMGQ